MRLDKAWERGGQKEIRKMRQALFQLRQESTVAWTSAEETDKRADSRATGEVKWDQTGHGRGESDKVNDEC